MNFVGSSKFKAMLFILALLIMAPAVRPACAADASKVAVVSMPPDFDLEDLNGTHVTLSQFKGQKPVLLYFWATWCPRCMEARPEVGALRKSIADSDLAILAINVGDKDSLARVKRYEEKNPAPYTVLYDTDSKVTLKYKVEGIPHFVLIDKNGAVKYQGNQLPTNPMSYVK